MIDQTVLSALESEKVDPMIQRFAGEIEQDTRKGFGGYLVKPDKLIEFATALS